ncbi:acyltransferase family protein [Curtobacterium oceanosedimentum]|uniref:acyltransferase family protein n=1 Tax=Curtobacterium oceanosedimentum TaxID=465820 RepID=UPI00073770DF|nr:acyltransferase family protein [Curtobacterium oceanosedimentum]
MSKTDATRRATAQSSQFRPDVEGLRALAVVLVILDHFIAWPAKGFVGVDVFFVISGFLITGLLLREYERTGTIAFGRFYLHRVRRIAPAAALTIVVTVAVGFLLFNVARARELLVDGFASLVFFANWRFAAQGTDYFQAGGMVSALQHFWSLSVEEQFYLVWPWLCLVIMAVVGRQAAARRVRAVVLTFAVLTTASFVWAVLQSVTAPDAAYFNTFSRTWELGAGAAVAAAATWLNRMPRALRHVLAWLGLAGIVGFSFFTPFDVAFPGPGAAFVVVSTALILAAGVGGPASSLVLLTNPVSRYIGRISYSLYLWHFPAIVFLRALFGEENNTVVPVALVVTLLASVLSYHLVEAPARRIPLDRLRLRRRADHHHEEHFVSSATKIAMGALVFVTASAVTLSALALSRPGVAGAVDGRIRAVVQEPSSSASGEAPDAGAADERVQAIQAALRQDEWPDLDPAVTDFGTNGRDVIASEWATDGCLGDDGALDPNPQVNTEHCVYGNTSAGADRTAIVYGDSVALSYVPGIRRALGSDWRIEVLTLAACPTSAVRVNRVDGSAFPECESFRTFAIDRVRTVNPALVIVSEASDDNRLVEQVSDDAVGQVWQDGAVSTLKQLAEIDGQVISFSRPPVGLSLYDCQTALSSPADCVSPVEIGFRERSLNMRAAAEQVGDGVRYVDTSTWFCSQGQCPAFIDSTPVFADGRHLTDSASQQIAPLIANALSDTEADQ